MATRDDGSGVSDALSPLEIADRLRRAGEVLRLRGESTYRAAAYETAADIVVAAAENVPALVAEGRLTSLRGIGPSLAATITELARTGRAPALEQIMGDLPPGLLQLAGVPGLTWRRIQALHRELGIVTLADLQQALAAGAVQTIKGFGPATAAKIREALNRPPAPSEARREHRVLVDVLDEARRLAERIRRVRDVTAVEIVGSVRRWVETVADVNLMAAAERADAAIDALARDGAVAVVEARAARGCRVRLLDGLRVTLDVERPERFATALIFGTGSAAHVQRLEERARARGLVLDALTGTSEEALYRHLDLPFIPPELREDAGEFAAADAGDTFADLVTVADIRGLVHCHTVHSDGRHTVDEMARAAADRGMGYVTITDHSTTASYAGGLSEDRLRAQASEIAAARARAGIAILRGTESDILKDGHLDFSDETLRNLDVVIASVHERHKLDADAMTERIVQAMAHPCFKIWGHPLGRLLLRRDPIACDVDRILDTITASRAAIEVNGSPWRLDLPPEWIRRARQRGIKFVVSVDAHSTSELDYVDFGVAMARRGGLRRGDVLNTLEMDAFAAAVKPGGQ